jgi:hypothetical protein
MQEIGDASHQKLTNKPQSIRAVELSEISGTNGTSRRVLILWWLSDMMMALSITYWLGGLKQPTFKRRRFVAIP